MKIDKIIIAAFTTCLLMGTACERDLLEQDNPNAQPVEQFWRTANDAESAVIAAYAALQQPGTYSRWIYFAYDLQSDEGYSGSPWTDLANFTRFVINNYNFEPTATIWTDHYRGIYRTNQIITNLQDGNTTLTIDDKLRRRLRAEAHFLRALYYFNLVSLYGNVPLALEPSSINYRPPQGTVEQVWNQIITDLTAAKPDLPKSYTEVNNAYNGRATQGAATALLGKVYMQLRDWPKAEQQFGELVTSGRYSLVPNYLDNFTMTNENNPESVFEVQFSDALQGAGQDQPGASEGNNRAQFFGPRQIGWSDGQPRRWLFNEFMLETDRNGNPDPRRDVTLIHSGLTVYGKTYAERGYGDPNELFWHKYQNDRTRNFENNHSGINIRVIRYADVLLMYAEALNELGRTAEAYPHINEVRRRSNMRTLEEAGKSGMTQDQMRTQIMHERVVELAGESVRWNDLKRWRFLDTQAGIDELKTDDPNPNKIHDPYDPDFNNFVIGKSALLPLPQTDVDIAKLKQNDNY